MAEQGAEHIPLTTFNISEVLLDMLLWGYTTHGKCEKCDSLCSVESSKIITGVENNT